MRYYLDTEFDGFRGPLISMALVREDGRSLYFIIEGAEAAAKDEWVQINVLPFLKDSPEPPWVIGRDMAAVAVAQFLAGDFKHGETPVLITDWPDDVRYFCDLIVHLPGETPLVGPITFEVRRVDAYPTTLAGAVQHNAWWDAAALQERVEADEAEEFSRFVGTAETA